MKYSYSKDIKLSFDDAEYKVKEALNVFDSIDTIDSLRLAKTVNRRAGENNIIMPAFLEIDFTDDPKRNGFRLGGNSTERHKQFIADIDEIGTLNNIELMGKKKKKVKKKLTNMKRLF